MTKQGFFSLQKRRFKKHKGIIWLVLPAFLFAFVFGYIPMLGVLLSFKEGFNVMRLPTDGLIETFTRSAWTLDNYKNLFKNADLISALKNTLTLNIVKLIITFPLTILLAILLSEIKKAWLAKLILIILCLPHFFSWSIVISIWKGLLALVGGAVNNILMDVGILDEAFWFFGENSWFKPLAIFISAWKSIGWSSILFYAAIMGIDKTFYEAATIDGANKFQKIIHLTVPSIMPTIALMFVMNITYIMSSGLEQIRAMMTSQTTYEQQVLDTYTYYLLEQSNSITGPVITTAIGVVNGIISLVLMLGGNLLVKKTLKTSLW